MRGSEIYSVQSKVQFEKRNIKVLVPGKKNPFTRVLVVTRYSTPLVNLHDA